MAIQPENTKLVIERWLDITIAQFQDKIRKLKIVDSATFLNSFLGTVITNAAGDLSRIEIAYKYYGKFADMGVGKGVHLGMAGKGNRRKPRKWYNPVFWRHFRRLIVIYSKNTARKGSLVIVDNLAGKLTAK